MLKVFCHSHLREDPVPLRLPKTASVGEVVSFFFNFFPDKAANQQGYLVIHRGAIVPPPQT
jgi:hypothetical protein